jgi:hypothetical protein
LNHPIFFLEKNDQDKSVVKITQVNQCDRSIATNQFDRSIATNQFDRSIATNQFDR